MECYETSYQRRLVTFSLLENPLRYRLLRLIVKRWGHRVDVSRRAASLETLNGQLHTSDPSHLQGKKDADYVFYELTRSICPQCRKVIDAKILLRDNKVYMAKRCPDCGPFEALVYGDAEAYVSFGKYNKPGTIPLAFGTEIKDGCPHDCGLCPDHQQHACLGIIEVNSACNMIVPSALPMRGPASA